MKLASIFAFLAVLAVVFVHAEIPQDGDEAASFDLMQDGPLLTEFPGNMTALDVRGGIVKAANALYANRATIKCMFPPLHVCRISIWTWIRTPVLPPCPLLPSGLIPELTG